MQGRTGKQEWVTSFMISYSTDAFQWQYITDKYGNQKVFQGNVNDHEIKHNYFDHSISARFVKFHTIQWFRHPSMRVEIVGCQGEIQEINKKILNKIEIIIYFLFKRVQTTIRHTSIRKN